MIYNREVRRLFHWQFIAIFSFFIGAIPCWSLPTTGKEGACKKTLQDEGAHPDDAAATVDERQRQLEIDLTSDNQLAAERAYTALITEYRPRLLSYIIKNFGSEFAEDIVQDTFLKVWTRRHAYKAGTSFSTWLHHIAINKAIDITRKSYNKLRVDLGPDIVPDSVHHDVPVSIHVTDSEEPHATFKRIFLPLLPDLQRRVIELTLEGKSPTEIEKITGKTSGNIGNAIFLAKTKIKTYINSLPEEQRGELRELLSLELDIAKGKKTETTKSNSKHDPQSESKTAQQDIETELSQQDTIRTSSEVAMNPNNPVEIGSAIRELTIKRVNPKTLFKDIPPLHRQIMILRLEGLPVTEISRRSNYTEEQIYRALANVLTLYKERAAKEFQATAQAELNAELASTHPQSELAAETNSPPDPNPAQVDSATTALIDSKVNPADITEGLPPLQSRIVRLRLLNISPEEISKRTGYTVAQVYRVIAHAQELHSARLAQKSAIATLAANTQKARSQTNEQANDSPIQATEVSVEKAIKRIKKISEAKEEDKFFHDSENTKEMEMLQKISQLPASRLSTFAEAQGPWFMKMFFENLTVEEGAAHFGISNELYTDRRARVRRELQNLLGEDYSQFAQSPSKFKEYMDAHFVKSNKEHSQKFMIALAQLGPLQRDVYRLFVMEGKSHEEIAQIHRMTHKAVISNLSHARENLNSILGENYEPLFWMSPTFKEACKKYNDKSDPNYLQNKLMFGLAYLTPVQRDTFYRVYVDGQSTADAATALGILPGSVYDNAVAAADNLRKDLGDEIFNACFPNGLQVAREN